MHYGIDLGAYYGDAIVNPFPGPGIVVMAEDVGGGTGLCTNINHPDVGKQTRYFHQSGFAVTAGDVVKQGQLIGWVGTSGGVDQHLHYEVRDLGTLEPEDPAPYVVPWAEPGVPIPSAPGPELPAVKPWEASDMISICFNPETGKLVALAPNAAGQIFYAEQGADGSWSPWREVSQGSFAVPVRQL
jgi:hypothetical protein